MSHFHFGGLAQSHAKTYTGFHRCLVSSLRCAIVSKVWVYTLTTIEYYDLLLFSLKTDMKAVIKHITGRLNRIIIFISIFLVKILMNWLLFVLSYKYWISRLKTLKGLISWKVGVNYSARFCPTTTASTFSNHLYHKL